MSSAIKLILTLCCLCTLTFAACLPARAPTDEPEEEQSRSRASGSQCITLPQTELTNLKTAVVDRLGWIKNNMTQAKTRITADLDSLPANSGFYPGSGERNNQEILAFGVPYLCCSVRYSLDVMRQEAVNPMLSVSSNFHAVYDLLDPEDEDNVVADLQKIVLGNSLNGCVIPNQECNRMSIESLGVSNFSALLATHYINLVDDLLPAINTELSGSA